MRVASWVLGWVLGLAVVGCGSSAEPDDGETGGCGCPEYDSDPRVSGYRCDGAVCATNGCTDGFLDCDGGVDCEVEVSVSNCGDCGASCDFDAAEMENSSGIACTSTFEAFKYECTPTCAAGYRDGDFRTFNGCEARDWTLVSGERCPDEYPSDDEDDSADLCEDRDTCAYTAVGDNGGTCTRRLDCDIRILNFEGHAWRFFPEVCTAPYHDPCEGVTCGRVDGKLCSELCSEGESCDGGEDCASESCQGGLCGPLAPTCEQAGCGSECEALCGFEGLCDEGNDCYSDVCEAGVCFASEGWFCGGEDAACPPGMGCSYPQGGGENRCTTMCEDTPDCSESEYPTCISGFCDE